MKNITRIFLSVSFALALACSANALPVVPINPTQQVELKYAGSIDNNPVYQLDLTNKDLKGTIQVSISDRNGVNLYRENVSSASFSRKFLINRDELGNEPVRVEISFSGDKRVLLYEINTTTRTQTENTVTRIF
jgi:hypothetical protein